MKTPNPIQLPSKGVCVAAAALAALMGVWAGDVYATGLGWRVTVLGLSMLFWTLGVFLGAGAGGLAGAGWRYLVGHGAAGLPLGPTLLWGTALGVVAGCASTFLLHVGLTMALTVAIGDLNPVAFDLEIVWLVAGIIGAISGAVLGVIGSFAYAYVRKRRDALS